MQLEGTVQDGVIVLNSACPFPDGTLVDVTLRQIAEQRPTLRERLMKLAGTVDDLPADLARNHDHYIHGAPRK